MDAELNLNVTPIFMELFKIHAKIDTLTKIILTDEQKNQFNQLYTQDLKKVIKDFTEDFPDMFTDLDILCKYIE